MKRIVSIAGAALLWAGCNERPPHAATPPVAEAQPGTGGSGLEGAEGTALDDRPFVGDALMISGRVERVENGSLTIREKSGETITFTVHPNTLVMVDGQERTIGELQEGAEIRAAFDPTPSAVGAQEGASEIQIETVPAQQ